MNLSRRQMILGTIGAAVASQLSAIAAEPLLTTGLIQPPFFRRSTINGPSWLDAIVAPGAFIIVNGERFTNTSGYDMSLRLSISDRVSGKVKLHYVISPDLELVKKIVSEHEAVLAENPMLTLPRVADERAEA